MHRNYGAEREGGTTYLRSSVRGHTVAPARGSLVDETVRVTPTKDRLPDFSATRSKPNPNDGLTPAAEEARAALESELSAVEQVAGPDAARRTATPDRIGERPGRDRNLGHDQGQYESAGAYYPGRERSGVFPLIAVALADNPDAVRTAYSEGWHAIEGTLTTTEIAILRRETPRLRKNVIAQAPDLADAIGKAEAEEIWSEAAANHAIAQANGEYVGGIHIAVRRIFAKIMRLLARIRNAVAGLGFRTSEDIFESFARGEMAVRREALPADMRTRWWRPETDEASSSIRRRGANFRPPARPPDKTATQSDRKNSGARASGPFDSNARPLEATTLGSRVAPESGGATFGSAGSKYHRTTFFKQNPELRGKVFVHHAVEQQVLKKYPGVVTEAEMHSLENLRGILRRLNSKLHLKQIRREWNRFYKENLIATRRQLLQKATEIDTRYGSQFNPPIKPGR